MFRGRQQRKIESLQPQLKLRWKFKVKGLGKCGRRGDTVTLVGDRIYCLGGVREQHFGAYLSTRNWLWSTIDAGVKRRCYAAAALADEKLYIYGGVEHQTAPDPFNDLLEFDLVLGTIAQIQTASGSPVGRSGMTAVFAEWRREIIFFGGLKSMGVAEPRTNETLCFNVDRKAWHVLKLKGELPIPRVGHSAELVGESMFVYGGFTTNMEFLGDMWIATLSLNPPPTWSRVEVKGFEPVGRTLSCLHKMNGTLLVFGGASTSGFAVSDLCVFCVKRNEWKSAPSSEVVVSGRAPVKTDHFMSVGTYDGAVFFTEQGVYKLTMVK